MDTAAFKVRGSVSRPSRCFLRLALVGAGNASLRLTELNSHDSLVSVTTDGGAEMGIPSYDQFIRPLLRVLFEHPNGLRASAAHELVAERVGLTSAEREELLPSGTQKVHKNRIGWAHDRLKRAQYSESASRGYWCLTEAGMDLATRFSELPQEVVDEIARPDRDSTASHDSSEMFSEVEGSSTTPEEQIDSAIRDLRESASKELLGLILQQSDLFFETLVLDVLRAMGYGAGPNSIKHAGGSHDGGIDGVISMDHLGLEKVYVQAKKWAVNNTVGRPDLQAFSGALRGQQATKGVFITTSSFSGPAKDFAERVSDSIVLVDGDRLTQLMIDYGVGVQPRRIIKLVDVDRDYFEGS